MKLIGKKFFFCIIIIVLQTFPINAQRRPSEAIKSFNEGMQESVPGLAIRKFEQAIMFDSLLVDAWYQLGKTHLDATGNLERAVESLEGAKSFWIGGTKVSLTDVSEIDEELDYINRKFKNLKIKLKSYDVDRLGFIEGVRLKFKYPVELDDRQKLRIAYFERNIGIGEFQFSNKDPIDNKLFFEIKYFPARDANVFSTGYIVDVLGTEEKRYRFDLTDEPDSKAELQFEWFADEWTMKEMVPRNLVKIEYPKKYIIESTNPSAFFTKQDLFDYYKNLYIPADSPINISLSHSVESNRERFYKILNSTVITVLTAGIFIYMR